MPAIHGNLGVLLFGGGAFHPNGKTKTHGALARAKPGEKIGSPCSARIIVGLHAGNSTVGYKIKDVIEYVKGVLSSPDASFIAQRGIFTQLSESLKGTVVSERGVQIFLIDMDNRDGATFTADMQAFAEGVARAFQQEAVILDVQERGISMGVYRVTP